MRSIVYGGVDFAAWCRAEVVEPCGHAVEPRTVAVPGRPGAVLLGGEVPPRLLTVRLYWDSLLGLDAAARAKARHEVYAALLATGGGALVVPGDPELTYRDAVCTVCGDWGSLFADASAEVGVHVLRPHRVRGACGQRRCGVHGGRHVADVADGCVDGGCGGFRRRFGQGIRGLRGGGPGVRRRRGGCSGFPEGDVRS